MKFNETPQAGQEIKLGFKLVKIVSVKNRFCSGSMMYLCLEKEGEKRMLYYNPRTKETGGSFERHAAAFGGSSKGNFKSWE